MVAMMIVIQENPVALIIVKVYPTKIAIKDAPVVMMTVGLQ